MHQRTCITHTHTHTHTHTRQAHQGTIRLGQTSKSARGRSAFSMITLSWASLSLRACRSVGGTVTVCMCVCVCLCASFWLRGWYLVFPPFYNLRPPLSLAWHPMASSRCHSLAPPQSLQCAKAHEPEMLCNPQLTWLLALCVCVCVCLCVCVYVCVCACVCVCVYSTI